MPKNKEELFQTGGVLYSHKEQKGMLKCSYICKHHPTGKSCEVVVWVSTIPNLFYLCRLWGEAQPMNWFYIPSTFK